MDWYDILIIFVFAVIWLVLVLKVFPKFGVSS